MDMPDMDTRDSNIAVQISSKRSDFRNRPQRSGPSREKPSIATRRSRLPRTVWWLRQWTAA
jgi:hypothetical protein